MSGKIKSGGGTLIGNAGEHYVVAELLKRGWIAALAPRNAPAYDILATNGDKTVRVRVKTKSAEYDIWQWNAKKDNETIFLNPKPDGDFTVLVDLTPETREMSYFIVPTMILLGWLNEGFQKWVKTPGKHGKPHNASNRKRHLAFKEWKSKLDEFKDWQVLWR